MNLNEIDGAAGAYKTFADVAIGKAFRLADETKYAKVSDTTAVRLDTANEQPVEATQGVYEYGAYAFTTTYPTWASISANTVARVGDDDLLKLESGGGLRLSDFAILTPGTEAPLAIATNVDGTFDP